MSDVGDRHFVLTEKIFFKRENTQQAIDHPPHHLHPPFPPRPDLGCDQIYDWNPQPFEPGGHTEVEIGGIGENGQVRLAPSRRRYKLPEPAPDSRQMPQNLHNADYSQVFRSDYWLDARFAQVRSRTSEELALRPAPLQFIHQFGGVIVTGRFTSRNQDGTGRGGQPSD